jgi:hypothetical protein
MQEISDGSGKQAARAPQYIWRAWQALLLVVVCLPMDHIQSRTASMASYGRATTAGQSMATSARATADRTPALL